MSVIFLKILILSQPFVCIFSFIISIFHWTCATIDISEAEHRELVGHKLPICLCECRLRDYFGGWVSVWLFCVRNIIACEVLLWETYRWIEANSIGCEGIFSSRSKAICSVFKVTASGKSIRKQPYHPLLCDGLPK